MAIPTIAGTATGAGTATTSGTIDLTGLSIAVGDVLVVRVCKTSTTVRTLTVTGGGLTWTTQQDASVTVNSYVATAIANSTTPFTITTTFSGSCTWQSRCDVINDADGGAAVDVSDKFTQSVTACFAAGVSGITTADNVIVLACFTAATTRTWTKGTNYTLDASGTAYIFQSRTSSTSLAGERPDATMSGGTGINSAACCISIKGAAAGASGQPTSKRWGGIPHNAVTRRGVW
jgi:hypothetical protein